MEEKYGPEDLERLLHSKEYDQLLPEEERYVLQHIAGREEYDTLRLTLVHIRRPDEDWELPSSMKDSLIQQFEAKNKRPGFRVWLNSLFAAVLPKENTWKPAFQLAFVAILVVGVVWFIQHDHSAVETTLAEQVADPIEEERSDKKSEAGYTDTIVSDLMEPQEESPAPELEQDEVDTMAEQQALENTNDLSDRHIAAEADRDEVSVDAVTKTEASLDIEPAVSKERLSDELEDVEDALLAEEVISESFVETLVQSEKTSGSVPTRASTADTQVEQLEMQASGSTDDASEPSTYVIPSQLLSEMYTAW